MNKPFVRLDDGSLLNIMTGAEVRKNGDQWEHRVLMVSDCYVTQLTQTEYEFIHDNYSAGPSKVWRNQRPLPRERV